MSGLRSAVVWGGAQTGIRLALGLVSIKVAALIIGPIGVALVGQLANVLSLLSGVIGNAIQTAVVKGTASEQAAGRAMPLGLWGTAARWLAGLSLVVAAVMVLASSRLAQWMFDDAGLGWVVALAAAVLPLTVLFQWLQGVLTGLKDFRLVAITQIVSSLIGVAIVVGLTLHSGLPGALAGTALASASSFVVAMAWVRHAGLPQVAASLKRWQPDSLGPMIAHYPMLLVHSASVPLAALFVRSMLIDRVGVAEAGLWQAATRITDNYTIVIPTILSMYVMPTLAGMRGTARFRAAVFRMALGAAVLVAAMASAVFIWREWIVGVLLSEAFRPVSELLTWMLIGDVFRMATWPLRSALVVQDRAFAYMLVEAGAAVCQIATTYALLESQGMQAAPVAYCLTWAVVLVVVVLLHARHASSNQ
ncbi:MAG: oligosaccharide flippase family protein [Burkholderiales bacterium]